MYTMYLGGAKMYRVPLKTVGGSGKSAKSNGRAHS